MAGSACTLGDPAPFEFDNASTLSGATTIRTSRDTGGLFGSGEFIPDRLDLIAGNCEGERGGGSGDGAAEDEKSGADAPANARKVAFAVLSLAIGMAVATLDGTFVAIMLPKMAEDLSGKDTYQWVGTGYLLTSTALIPVWGKLSDIFGRRELLTVLMFEFTAISAMCALSKSMLMLILARALQGIGGGAISSLSFIIIGEIVSPLERGKYMGIMSAVMGFCALIGPFVGGLIADHLSWRWGFWLNLPIGLAAIFSYQFTLKLTKPEGTMLAKFKRVDFPGVFLSTAAITLLLLGVTWGGVTFPWTSIQVLAPIGAFVAVLAVFFWWEKRAREPVVPLSLLFNLNYVLVTFVSFVANWGMYGLTYFLPMYFQRVLGLSTTETGYMNLPFIAFMIPTSFVVGMVIMKTGKYVMYPQLGLALATVGIGLLSLLDENSAKWFQIVPQLLCGLGLGMNMSTGNLMTQTNAPDDLIGPATSVGSFLKSLGGVVGIAVFATVTENVYADETRLSITHIADEYHLTVTTEQLELFVNVAAMVDLSTYNSEALSALQTALKHSYAKGLSRSFISFIPLGVVAFICALLIKHVPLRKTAKVQIKDGKERPTQSDPDPEVQRPSQSIRKGSEDTLYIPLPPRAFTARSVG
ncbi:MFS general substrate transporter [Gonapodya prolifera JEL478]|uniref:MFS general substrate transporter n=1 Tax=Gonapodya prolifera (strain JEL478) TaxID=1344416 RepID=A0A139AL02_GONPJ|nr:MFS general substrate transporter [Gonapodya prolifera JEL478]|eukprot:KXS17469.1 MFS general substrate transporter [Gonapodya prolifera JEL478]